MRAAVLGRVLDEAVPAGNIPMVLACCALMLACIAVNILFTTLSSRCVNVIGQNIVHDLRRDLYEHLQKLSFSYFDSRPHGKILVRVINYVNSVANILSNGLISLFLQMFNLVFIVIFMLRMDARLACVVLAGLPFAVGFILFIKPMQRRGWQAYSNKSSNMNAYLNESITCMKITQLFAREQYNADVYDGLLRDSNAPGTAPSCRPGRFPCYRSHQPQRDGGHHRIRHLACQARRYRGRAAGHDELRLPVLGAHQPACQHLQQLHQQRGISGAYL